MGKYYFALSSQINIKLVLNTNRTIFYYTANYQCVGSNANINYERACRIQDATH